MKRLRVVAAMASVFGVACAGGGPAIRTIEEPLRSIVRSEPSLEAFARSPAHAERRRVQILLGVVDDAAAPGERPILRQVGWRAGTEYFYPASAVKLFAAVAALERLRELRQQTAASGLDLDADTPLVYHPLFEGEVLADTDPSNLESGTITVRHEIRKLFLVSDNEAFNRLYELVGQDRLAATLEGAGVAGARLVHRLSEPRSAEENRRSPRIEFVRRFEGQDFRHEIPERLAPPLRPAPPIPGLMVGQAYISGQETITRPMDFAGKNRVALAELQRGLCMVVTPEVDCGGPGFSLGDADRDLLLEPMSQYPRESTNPLYDPAEYPDDYAKYLLPGIERVVPKERVRIYNKIGQAYGFMTDNAWIVDTETGRGFFLAATIYTNEDGVLNDDEYEYDTVAKPFFADLGEAAARWFWTAAQPKKK